MLEKRFRVYRIGNEIHLHGIISDTSNLGILDEMVSDSNVIDCSHVEGASWNGLLALDRYLSRSPGHTVLTRVPYHVFKYLRLLPSATQKYQLGEIELSLMPGGQKAVTTRYFRPLELENVSSESRSPFCRLKDGSVIIGRNSFVCPSKFGKHFYDPETVQSIWYRNNTQQFDFWYDYSSFTNITMYLALDLVQSLESTLEDLIKDLAIGVGSLHRAMSILFPNDAANQSIDFGEIISEIKSSCCDLSRRIEKVAKSGWTRLIEMQLLAEAEDFTDPNQLYKILEDNCADIMSLHPAIVTVENVGHATSQQLCKISGHKEVKDRLLTREEVAGDLLEAVREAMGTMDPLSEGDWVETRKEFFDQLNSMDKDINKVVILLQGFDLLRQILEHRMRETMTIRELGHGDWQEVKKQVFALVNRTLVTDQEKYSCEFFIPEAARVEEGNQKPGDILFF